MKEFKLEGNEPKVEEVQEVVQNAQGTQAGGELPAKVSIWSKISGFLFQEIDLSKPIVLELTPKEEKVLTEVHDFLFQEVKFPELHDFLFQEIHFFDKKNKEET